MVTYNVAMEHELVFKALGDASRRQLLDLLFLKDGRSLSELEEHLPMTRFGVMKHLRLLKQAGLITTRKSGRETLHYLNAVPIQMVYDRWVSKYSKGWARTLTELKYDLEEKNNLETIKMAEAKTAETTTQVFEVYIRTSAEKLWQAITQADFTEKYYFGSRIESDLKAGSGFNYMTPDGKPMVEGKVVKSDPPRKLVTTFNPTWAKDADSSFPETRVTYEIEQQGSSCKLSLVHEGLPVDNPMTQGIFGGWSQILSGLKTLLETGEPLVVTPAGK